MDLVVIVSFWFGGLLLALMPIPRILAWLGPIGVVALFAHSYQEDITAGGGDSQSTLIVLTGLVAVAIAITFVLCGYVLRHFLERS